MKQRLSIRVRFTSLAVFFCFLSASWLNAQHLPVGEALDTYLFGKVRLDGRGAPPDLAAIEAICAGHAYVMGFSGADGRFALLLQQGGARLFTGLGMGNVSRDALARCELRVSLPGYRSGRVAIRSTALGQTVGTISISRLANARDAAGSPNTEVSPTAAKAYRKGADALGNSLWSKAADSFEKALAEGPEYARAWVGMGMAREGSGEFDQALTSYGKAITLSRSYSLAYVRYASVAARLGKWQEAAQYSEAGFSLDPQAMPEAYLLCAQANLKLTQLDVAESAARQGLRIDAAHDYPQLHLLLAQALASRGASGECARELGAYLALVPDDENAAEIKKEMARLGK
jgi:tetratricopeptide (TPR) repeat protein